MPVIADDDSDIGAEAEAEDILLLATLIGIDADEVEYLWIAKEAYQADLPSGWEIYFDEEGKHFYFNTDTHASTYEHPSIEYYRKLYHEFKQKDEEFKARQREKEVLQGLSQEDEDETEEGGDAKKDKPSAEMTHKARLLQTFSNDPTIAAKFRKDMAEQEQKASTVLEMGLLKEEADFEKRLKSYVQLKEDSQMKPLENVLANYAQQSDEKLDRALQALTQQMHDLKEKSMQNSNEAILEALKKAQIASTTDSAKSKRLGMLSTQNKECTKCKVSEDKIHELEKQVTQLKEQQSSTQGVAFARVDSAPMKEAIQVLEEKEKKSAKQLKEAEAEIEQLQQREKQLKEDNRRLKRKLARGVGGGNVDFAQVDGGRDEIAAMAEQAAAADMETPALHVDETETLLAATRQEGDEAEELDEEEEDASGDMKRLLKDFGLSEQDLMDIMERLEGMQGGTDGPLAKLRAQVVELEALVAQKQEEIEREKEHAEQVQEVNKQYIASLAKVETVTKELQRAKDHSEHMEFLAQQYSDQVNQLHSSMRKMREDIAFQQRIKEEERNNAREEALKADSPIKAIASVSAQPTPSRTSSKFSSGSTPFVVRVRASTIRDVKQGASTLRNALNLLKIDFQAYAEGIFLPIARQLQQNTLSLATALSSKSRDLRLSHDALDASLAGQRHLEERLRLVYSINFHTFCYLRPVREHEKSIFRSPTPRQITMALENGFENKRDQLEMYDFDRVFGPESDIVSVFHEIVPHISRVLNWGSACVVISGGRNSDKDRVAISADVGAFRGTKGVMQKSVEYMGQIYQNEVDSLQRQRILESYEVTFSVELSEIFDESCVHMISTGKAKEGKEKDADEDGGGKTPTHLFDVKTLITQVKKKELTGTGSSGEMVSRPESGGSDASEKKAEAAENLDETAEEEEEEEAEVRAAADDEKVSYVPTHKIQNAVEGLRLVEEAFQKSQGALRIKQAQLDRESSEAVQRSKRLAKPGSRNELGELIAEPHYVLSIAVSKRDRQTDATKISLLKIVLIGCPGEYEDTQNDDPNSGIKFKADQDQSTFTLHTFLGKRYLRETDVNAEIANSELSSLLWDVMGDDSAIIFLTAVSPSAQDFLPSVKNLRFGSKAVKARPTTASRLERVKYRWMNQSTVWAFTLWKGAVADSLAVQQGNEIANLKEEVQMNKQEIDRLNRKIQEMADEGVAYVSGGEEKQNSDDDVGDADASEFLLQQKRVLEKLMGKDLTSMKMREEGVVLQAVTAKLRYTQSRMNQYEDNNRNLSKALKAERQRARLLASNARSAASTIPANSTRSFKGGVRMPELPGVRSGAATSTSAPRRTSFPSAVSDEAEASLKRVGSMLPPANKRQAYG